MGRHQDVAVMMEGFEEVSVIFPGPELGLLSSEATYQLIFLLDYYIPGWNQAGTFCSSSTPGPFRCPCILKFDPTATAASNA
jgi:hypothetical protein